MAFRRELALRWRISRRVPVQHDRGGRIVDQWRCDVIQARRDDRTLGHVSGNSDTNPLAIIPQVPAPKTQNSELRIACVKSQSKAAKSISSGRLPTVSPEEIRIIYVGSISIRGIYGDLEYLDSRRVDIQLVREIQPETCMDCADDKIMEAVGDGIIHQHCCVTLANFQIIKVVVCSEHASQQSS
jgi:hypothetical protein